MSMISRRPIAILMVSAFALAVACDSIAQGAHHVKDDAEAKWATQIYEGVSSRVFDQPFSQDLSRDISRVVTARIRSADDTEPEVQFSVLEISATIPRTGLERVIPSNLPL